MMEERPKKKSKTESNKQLKGLLEAIKKCKLMNSQSKSARLLKRNEMLSFIKEKLESLREKSSTDTFSYLEKHAVQSNPSQVGKCKVEMLNKHGPCYIHNNHSQLKLPIEKEASPSDSKNGKKYGLLQIQAYVVSCIADECNSIEELEEKIEKIINSGSNIIGGHTCKRKCMAKGHCILTDSIVNTRNHETCPAYWVIRGKLYSFCSCDSKHSCIVPGPSFKPELFVTLIETLINDL